MYNLVWEKHKLLEQKEIKGVTYFVKLMKSKRDAHHNDGEGTIVSPSIACWTWKGKG